MYRSLILIFLANAIGCSAAPARPIPLQLNIEVANDANPDEQGRSSPVVLSVLDLAQPARFHSCAYLALLSTPRKCLHGDLLATSRTHAVAPGGMDTIEFSAEPGSAYIGIVAELVQFADARNRIDIPLRTGKSNLIKLRIDSHGIAPNSDDRRKGSTRGRFNDD